MQDGILKYALEKLDPEWLAKCTPGEVAAIERAQQMWTENELEYVARSIKSNWLKGYEKPMSILGVELAKAAVAGYWESDREGGGHERPRKKRGRSRGVHGVFIPDAR
jgi:hypothetical protein